MNPPSGIFTYVCGLVMHKNPSVGDRAAAIRAGVAGLKQGDTLLVAGKGHETGQIIGGKTIPFSDHDAVKAALNA